MKRLLVYSLICFLSGVMLISCERGVKAGREEPQTYQPRPAPVEERATAVKDVQGQLISVDMKNNTVMIRTENGMEQTFRFNDQTKVQGMEPQSTATNRPQTMAVRDLTGKEGSEVTVSWKDEAGAKMATTVTVNQLVSRKASPKRK
jgi:hypothetical protein